MNPDPNASEADVLAALRRETKATFGEARATEIDGRITLAAHWMWLLAQQPLDLLEAEPDTHGR